jgi:radical SAM superfamily enzyme YgiQ (UPF0313 family)
MKIFLADLQNSHYRLVRNSVPIGMGYVASHLDKEFGNKIKLLMFRKFEELYDELNKTEPDLIALASFSWNTNLTDQVITYLRERVPNVTIVVAGPNVSAVRNRALRFFNENKNINYLIPNEAEQPLANIINLMIQKDNVRPFNGIDVQGCFYMNTSTGEIEGSSMDRYLGNINDIPSPYLNGMMDRFLSDENYLPIIQTARGCPYRCTFCVSGKESWNKIRQFDIERVYSEIDYIQKKSKTPFLRLADENFGVLNRDVEIAEYIVKKNNETGFPTGMSIYTDKNPTDRVKKINLLLKDYLPFCISFQSATPEVLKNIKRINLRESNIQNAIDFTEKHNLKLVSELIFGLPGETVESFNKSIDRLVGYGFESIILIQLYILRGSEMDLIPHRDSFKVGTRYAMSENGYTNHPEITNIELDEWVVSTSTIPEKDWFNFNRNIFLFDFLHGYGFGRELIFFFHNYGIRPSELLMTTLSNDSDTTINKYANLFRDTIKSSLFETREEATHNALKGVKENPNRMTGVLVLEEDVMIDILVNDDYIQIIEEIAEVGRKIYFEKFHLDSNKRELFEDALTAILDFIPECTINLNDKSKEEVSYISNYNIKQWVEDKYKKPLDNYKTNVSHVFRLKISSLDHYQRLWTRDLDIRSKYRKQFAIMNSRTMRRFFAN